MHQKNSQEFSVVGLNFDSNYGQPIHACFEFLFKGFEISVSNGAIWPSRGLAPVLATPVLVRNLATGEDHEIPGSVEDAINFVIKSLNLSK